MSLRVALFLALTLFTGCCNWGRPIEGEKPATVAQDPPIPKEET